MRRLIAFLYLITVSLTAKVKWIPNTNFNLPINFKDGKVPCPRQTVVFPDTLNGYVNIDSLVEGNELILPIDGEFLLSEGGIELGGNYDNCTDTRNVYFLEKSVSSWAQPDVWSSSKFNEATPDAERVPCFDDLVEFPADKVFTIALPAETQVVRGIHFGSEAYDTGSFMEFVTESQQFILNENQVTGVVIKYEQCKSRSGCPCQENPLKIDCNAKFCPVPACVDPIQPIGHCCKMCGGVIAFDVDQSFDIMNFKELVETVVDSYGKDDLVYYIGRVGDKVQLVVIDKGEYSGTSAEVVNDIDHSMEKHWVQGLKESIISGSPLYKYGLGGKIFISMFFVVVVSLGGIYAYYYKLPDVSFPTIGGPAMLSRYQRRSDSVVLLTRRDSVITTRSGISTAFRNPLYDSKRGRVVIDDPNED
ncbi:unnamed protein product [Leptosia nina]|uniref:Protein amnionless n=1 Tax=Leptosia nina TaxID=320188 RepID=A0AAV1JTH1_9NEOP